MESGIPAHKSLLGDHIRSLGFNCLFCTSVFKILTPTVVYVKEQKYQNNKRESKEKSIRVSLGFGLFFYSDTMLSLFGVKGLSLRKCVKYK